MGGLQKKILNSFIYFYSAEHMVAAAAAAATRAASVRLKGLNIVFNGCYYITLLANSFCGSGPAYK